MQVVGKNIRGTKLPDIFWIHIVPIFLWNFVIIISMIIKYKNSDLGFLLLRLGLATVFFFEGINKIKSFAGTARFFASLGFAVPVLYFIIAVELIAAMVFLLGILSEWGCVIAIEMAVIIVKIRLPHGGLGGALLELTILAAALTLALGGPGKYSLGAIFAK